MALVKTFKVVGLHTVRYTDHEWSGVWIDMPIEQRLTKAATSSGGGGLSGGIMRTHESAHNFISYGLQPLDQNMALINERI